MNNPIRSFIAAHLSDELKSTIHLIQRDLKELDIDCSWVSSPNLHLTLKFLGNFPHKKLDSVAEAFRNSVQNISAFDVELNELGAFPKIDRPQILWLGLTGDLGTLQKMVLSIEDCFGNIGFAKERRAFEPHITVGRLRSNKNLSRLVDRIKNYAFPKGVAQKITHVTLYKSTLTSQGAVYEALETADLPIN